MDELAVDIRDIRKVFNPNSDQAVTALDGVSLGIKDNEFFTLLGPSGCGKTTLLRLIAGFEQPTEGEILLYGERIERLTPHERPVNTVFQHYALFPHMTVFDNIAFGLEMLGRSKQDIQDTVMRMLELVKMPEYAKRKPQQLSGGQQQRIALARALAPSPKVLLLDEPLSALDLQLRHEMRSELKTLQRETGVTFVFVTHDQEEALSMSDRIAVMSNGLVQQVGQPEDIYETPNNRFVADFIGRSNFLEVVVKSQDADGTLLALNDSSSQAHLGDLSFTTTNSYTIGDSLTLVLRPEKMTLSVPTTSLETNQIAGQVKESMYLGTDTNYSIEIANNTFIEVRDQQNSTGQARFQIGDKVFLNISPDALMVIDDSL